MSPLHPKRPDPKFSRRLSVASSTKSLKTFCCHLSTWNPYPSTTTTNNPFVTVAACVSGTTPLSPFLLVVSFFPSHSIFNRNGLCIAIHRLGQGRCRRPEGCRQRPWPAQRSPALLQIRPRRCRLLLDNTRCPHPRRCVRRFFLTCVPIPSTRPQNLVLVSASRPMHLPLPAVAGRSSIRFGDPPSALRTVPLTIIMTAASRPVSSSTLPPTTEA